MSEALEEYAPNGSRSTWARLVHDHDRITDRCRRLATLTRLPAAEGNAQATVVLLELAILLADHLGVEDEVMDRTHTAIEAGRSPEQAETMRITLETLKADWARFVGNWTARAVALDWERFGTETEVMMTRLSNQVREENDLLYAPALKHNIIRLGVVTPH